MMRSNSIRCRLWGTASRLGIPVLFVTLILSGVSELFASEESQHITVLMVAEDPADSAALILRIRLQEGSIPVEVHHQRIAEPWSIPLEKHLIRHLDRNGNGKLTITELRQAEHLLTELDWDDDEQLAPLEIAPGLLSESGERPSNIRQQRPGIFIAYNSETLTTLKTALAQLGLDSDLAIKSADAVFDYSTAQNRLIKSKAPHPSDDRSVIITKTPTGWLVRKNGLLFDLLIPEVKAFTQLKTPQAEPELIKVHTRPGRRGWFELLDRNGDSMLSRTELREAPVMAKQSRLSLEATAFTLTVRSGSQPHSRGIRLVNEKRDVDFRALPLATRWSTAMDTNRDGVVSRQEFLGSTRHFDALDRDHDQLITLNEVQQAGKQEHSHLSTTPRKESE